MKTKETPLPFSRDERAQIILDTVTRVAKYLGEDTPLGCVHDHEGNLTCFWEGVISESDKQNVEAMWEMMHEDKDQIDHWIIVPPEGVVNTNFSGPLFYHGLGIRDH